MKVMPIHPLPRKIENKGGLHFTLADPSPYLSARAISRRTRYSIAVDSTDLPVPASYSGPRSGLSPTRPC